VRVDDGARRNALALCRDVPLGAAVIQPIYPVALTGGGISPMHRDEAICFLQGAENAMNKSRVDERAGDQCLNELLIQGSVGPQPRLGCL
jgi:hypothetical protein